MRKMGILLAGAIALAACSRNPPPAPPAPVDLNNPLLAPGFLAQAGSANEWEMELDQLALQMSTKPGVQNFANMIIADHLGDGRQPQGARNLGGPQHRHLALLPQATGMLIGLAARAVRCAGHGLSAGPDRGAPTGDPADAELCRQWRRAGAENGRLGRHSGDAEASVDGPGAGDGAAATAADGAAAAASRRRARAHGRQPKIRRCVNRGLLNRSSERIRSTMSPKCGTKPG